MRRKKKIVTRVQVCSTVKQAKKPVQFPQNLIDMLVEMKPSVYVDTQLFTNN